MIKQDIINEIVNETGISEYDVHRVIDEAIQSVTRALKKLEDVTIRGFGVFKIIERKPRTGRNIKTGEPVHIGSRRVVTFEPGKDLKNI